MERMTIIDLDNSAHPVTRSGELFAFGTIAGLPLTLLTDAQKIKDYRDGLKRPSEIMARIRRLGWRCETRLIFGEAKPRYALVAYRDTQERRAAIMRANGKRFYFLPMFGFSDPESIPTLPADYGVSA